MIRRSLYTLLTIILLVSEGILTILIQLPDKFQMVPYFVYAILMLLAFKYTNKWLLSLIIIYAIIYDVLYTPYYFMFLILYLLSYLFIVKIKKIFFVNFFVEFIVILLGMTIIDSTLFVINELKFPQYYYFLEYASHRLGISLLVNSLVIVLLYIVIQLIERIKWHKTNDEINVKYTKSLRPSLIKRLK